MRPLPATDLRSNRGTWAVTAHDLPARAAAMTRALPPEPYDPDFCGQRLTTTYLDTAKFDLRRARVKGDRYLTLRLRKYDTVAGRQTFAVSAKTEAAKFRREIDRPVAYAVLTGDADALAEVLPADLFARLVELTGGAPLLAVVEVSCRRYAREDAASRLTLDVRVTTDTGLRLPYHVLEHKSTDAAAAPPACVAGTSLRPVKLSKFLWATEPLGR